MLREFLRVSVATHVATDFGSSPSGCYTPKGTHAEDQSKGTEKGGEKTQHNNNNNVGLLLQSAGLLVLTTRPDLVTPDGDQTKLFTLPPCTAPRRGCVIFPPSGRPLPRRAGKGVAAAGAPLSNSK